MSDIDESVEDLSSSGTYLINTRLLKMAFKIFYPLKGGLIFKRNIHKSYDLL